MVIRMLIILDLEWFVVFVLVGDWIEFLVAKRRPASVVLSFIFRYIQSLIGLDLLISQMVEIMQRRSMRCLHIWHCNMRTTLLLLISKKKLWRPKCTLALSTLRQMSVKMDELPCHFWNIDYSFLLWWNKYKESKGKPRAKLSLMIDGKVQVLSLLLQRYEHDLTMVTLWKLYSLCVSNLVLSSCFCTYW